MLRHQLGQNLVLALDLLLQKLDAFLLGLVVGAGFGLESGGPVLEELFLPAVENRRLQPQFVTQLGDRLLFQQMSPEDGDLLFCGVVLPLFFHAFSLRYLNGRTLSPFPAEAGQMLNVTLVSLLCSHPMMNTNWLGEGLTSS